MAETGNDKSDSSAKPPKWQGPTPPPARAVRRTVEEVVPPDLTDAFAIPVEPAAPPDQPQVLPGLEPPIFGGVNPPVLLGQSATTPAEEVPNPQPDSQDAQEEEVAPPRLLPKDVADLKRIARSIPVLLTAMVISLALSLWIVNRTIPLESYAQVTVELANYTSLSPEDAANFRSEIQRILSLYPLRASAIEHLTKIDPTAGPGFLSGGAVFQGANSVEINETGTLYLRILSDSPAEEMPRMKAVALAFRDAMDQRSRQLEARRGTVDNLKLHLTQLQAQLADARKEAGSRPPATEEERRQNAAVEQSLLQLIDKANGELKAAEEAADQWVDVRTISEPTFRDNRIVRQTVLYGVALICVAVFGGAIAAVKVGQFRETAKRRRLRRTQSKTAAASKSPDVPANPGADVAKGRTSAHEQA